MLDLLHLFTPENTVLDVETICTLTNHPQTTTYRYIRELAAAGFLQRLPNGYTLGPRIIELDRQMRNHDPILVYSKQIINELAEQTGLTILLSQLFGDRVISIHQEIGKEKLDQVDFSRGKHMPLFQSATARVILAYLLPRQLKKVFEESHPNTEDPSYTWKSFSKDVLAIKKNGYSISEGSITPNTTGIAAPIFNEKKRILGSLTLIGPANLFKVFNETYLANLVMHAADLITQQIVQGEPITQKPILDLNTFQ
ncbi:MAG: IclR family transcriptional regulator [Alcaligenaceae bacterium]|nr:IclR family transcriptional regulator [Alcaligenaceae bacterium]